MTSNALVDGASVWQKRAELKPHYRDGLSVRLDHVGEDGKNERIHVSNEDDYMWGSRRTKAAAWTLEVPEGPHGGPDKHAQLI